MCSSAATLAMPSGMPMPRLTTALGRSSIAARRAIPRGVAVRVGGSAAKERGVQPLERLVEQVLLTADRHQLDAVFGRRVVDLSSAVARVDERVEADPREEAGFACGGAAEQLGDDPLRQVVRLALVVYGHLSEFTRHP